MKHKLQQPGSVQGPCDDACVHTSCAMQAATAKQACPVCKKPIGYNVFYEYVDDVPVHSNCIEADSSRAEDNDYEEPEQTTSKLG